MKPLFNEEELKNANATDTLPCECYYCKKTFYTETKRIKHELKTNGGRCKFCSRKCFHLDTKKIMNVSCLNCNSKFMKHMNQVIKHPNHFCSQSCAATYNNKHKSYGTKRSKLEIWLEEQLNLLYPNLEIHYNQKSAINSELDIYIPSLNIAFELNGVVHYEPIYGIDKLNQIQENDISKSKACHDARIDLCIIDTSQQKYVKPSTSKKYLDIIKSIIKERLSII